jgi:hypothetical protein
MSFKKDDLVNSFKQIIPKNFKLSYHPGVLFLENKSEKRLQRISFGFTNFFPEFIYFNGITCQIIFYEIEKILIEESQKIGVKYSAASTFNYFPQANSDLNIKDLEITSIEDFSINKTKISKLISETCLPALDKYSDIETVANLLSPLSNEEIVPYIQGPILFSKTILILKETNHPNFKIKRDEFYSILKTYENNHVAYKEQLKLFEHLFFEN